MPGGHLQTLWPSLVRWRPRPVLRRERLELPDGDFLDLDWTERRGAPLVVVLHGLEGSARSPYAAGLLRACAAAGMQGVLMHFRGCSGEPNRLPRSYHSGETGDLAHLVGVLRRRYPTRPLGVVGYSLGGNVLLKWLGECADAAPVQCAAAVSVPFLLGACADRLEQGLSQVYQHHLLGHLRASVRRKFQRLEGAPCELSRLRSLNSFRRFDDAVTAPLHGFADAQDYYRRCSSRPFLRHIQVPTLILHAEDDPFMTPEVVPRAHELAPAVTLELATSGGHVGFVEGRIPGWGGYWLERRLPEWFQERLGGEAPALATALVERD